jgi:hypothetical protein
MQAVKEFTKIQKKKLHEIAAKTPTIQPFLDDNPQKKRDRIKRATGEGWPAFSFFATQYFPHVITKDFCPAHKEIHDEIEINNHGVTAITGFRGLGKTVLFGPLYELWALIRGESYIVNVAADEDLAEERNMFIYNELSNNARLLNDFPELQILEGEEKDFYLRNKARVRARSIRQAVRGTINPKTGQRPGIIDCDDIDKEENIGNYKIGKRKLDKILSELLGALDPGRPGKVLWKGNLTHPNLAICQLEDLLIDEIKEDPAARPEQRKHLRSGKKLMLRFPVEDENGNSIWEQQYPTSSLPEIRKTMGMVNYQRDMLGKKIIEGKVFKWEWFKRWHKKIWKSKAYARLYADLAPGEKNCYKAIVGGARHDSKYYITHLRVRQEKNSAFFRAYYEAYLDLHKKHGHRFKAYVEANFDQYRSFCRDMDIWCTDNGLPSITHKIKKYYNKGKKTERIESLETIVEQAKILMPDGQDTKTLTEQFLAYPDGFLDGPDAVEGWLQQFPGYNPSRGRARVRAV